MKKLLVIILLCSCSPKIINPDKLKAKEETKARDRKTVKATIVILALGYLMFRIIIPVDEFNN